MSKKLVFQCWGCTNRFTTDEWYCSVEKDDPHSSTVARIIAKCPKCGVSCHINYTLCDLLNMIFDLQNKEV